VVYSAIAIVYVIGRNRHLAAVVLGVDSFVFLRREYALLALLLYNRRFRFSQFAVAAVAGSRHAEARDDER